MPVSEAMKSRYDRSNTAVAVPEGDAEVFDVVGVGLGPANLALAVCLQEEAEASGGRDLHRCFFEVRRDPMWHPGMLLEDSQLQISVLKDLATIRNPRSRFTFLNYLQEKGRLFEFLNLRELFPSRYEFNDYLNWVGAQLGDSVRYGQEVIAIEPVSEAASPGSGVELLRVVAKDTATGELTVVLTRNLVLATGGVPATPRGVELRAGGRAFHPQEFMQRIKRDYADKGAAHRFVVVGAGQSGAELFYYLLNHYPEADVTAAIRRFSYKPVDDSDFTNEIFFPQMVDFVYQLPSEKRRMVLEQCKDVNYAVVDTPLIRRIYRFLYQEKVEGRSRARIHSFLQLVGIEERSSSVLLTFEDMLRDRLVEMEADGAIVATGYTWRKNHPALAPLSSWFQLDATGGYRIERDYRVATEAGFRPGVYLQGFSEETHGASEPVLSLVPVRAGDITRSILATTPAKAYSE